MFNMIFFFLYFTDDIFIIQYSFISPVITVTITLVVSWELSIATAIAVVVGVVDCIQSYLVCSNKSITYGQQWPRMRY